MHFSVLDLWRIWYRFFMDFRHPWSCEKTILTLYSLQKTRNWQFRNRISCSSISASISYDLSIHFSCFSILFGHWFSHKFLGGFWMAFWIPSAVMAAKTAPGVVRSRAKCWTKSSVGVSPDPARACSMLHVGHIGRFGCIFRWPRVPFGMVFSNSGDPFPSVSGRLWEEFLIGTLAFVTLKIRARESPIVPKAPLRNVFRKDIERRTT